jgi:hypothetical protein
VRAIDGALIGEPIETRRAELRGIISDHGPVTFPRAVDDGAARYAISLAERATR